MATSIESKKTSQELQLVNSCPICEMVRVGQIDMGVVLKVFFAKGKLNLCPLHTKKLEEGIDGLLQSTREQIVKYLSQRT
jgi:hypothetical protein